jgi:hypothetical protein
MAGRLRSSLGAAALAALFLLPAPAQAAPASTPAARAWSDTAASTPARRSAARVRHRHKRSRSARSEQLGSRGLDDAHAAPLALAGLDDLWPRGVDRIVVAAARR